MRMYDIIAKKRDGKTLTGEEITFLIDGYVDDSISDYQMSAFLMATFLQGMNDEELAHLTMAMAHSGQIVDLSPIEGVKVDKHSTGGVGDKTTFIVGPLVAACGGKVAKMSGRGLGHTGGTIDKMESIHGLASSLSREDFFRIVNEVGIAVIGQSGDLTPADKKIYALRDVTATVNSIPLIASSIMSKKLASGSDAIVLDVKVGSGAFMKNMDDALCLAEKMVAIGTHNGKKVIALITDMDRPLGKAIGNALEMKEVVATLRGEGPEDLVEESLIIATNMLYLTGKGSMEDCEKAIKEALQSGKAYQVFCRMVEAQGGQIDCFEDDSLWPQAPCEGSVYASQEGYIGHMDTEKVGQAAVALGAGRLKKGAPIDYGAGIILEKKTGDFIKAGHKLATCYGTSEKALKEGMSLFEEALTISQEAPPRERSIKGRVTADGRENYVDATSSMPTESPSVTVCEERTGTVSTSKAKLINMQGQDVPLAPTEVEWKALGEAARKARDKAYVPYSQFPVGAALMTADGTIFSGCNIENASYGLTNCAERTAIFKAISEGHRYFKGLYVVAHTAGPCTPCGACRQVMEEFAIPYIMMANLQGEEKLLERKELLPCAFTLLRED